jgi:hypothetical protein
MIKFAKVIVTKDIIIKGILIVKAGTKGMILRLTESNPFVRFSTGRMMKIPKHLLMVL